MEGVRRKAKEALGAGPKLCTGGTCIGGDGDGDGDGYGHSHRPQRRPAGPARCGGPSPEGEVEVI